MKTPKISPKILAGFVSVSASFITTSTGAAQNNGISAFPMSVDGRFTNPLEWSDVTPAYFLSAPGVSAVPLPTSVGANSALYAALGTRGLAGEDPSLHLLYDFLPRTNPFVAPGELVASITFPVHLPNDPDPLNRTNVSVLFTGGQLAFGGGGGVAGGSFFDIFVDLDLDGTGDVRASTLGIAGAADFAPSPLGAFNHLIVELGVSLRIPAGFGDGTHLPGNGINPATGLYDPDPAFWGAAGGGDGTPTGASGGGAGEMLQSASTANFQIFPNGSTQVTPVLVPEPTSAALLIAGLGAFAARRRRQSAV